MEENDLKNSSQWIYNVDESGVPLDPKGLNIDSKAGSRKVQARSTGRKGQVTVVACGNASGQFIVYIQCLSLMQRSCVVHGHEQKYQVLSIGAIGSPKSSQISR